MAEFSEALLVPAAISTLRKIQHDSDQSLRILACYRRSGRRRALSHSERAALEDVLENVVKQSVDAVIFFAAAILSVKSMGAIGGQTAQALISINYMTAPKKQFLKPRDWLAQIGIDPVSLARSTLSNIPDEAQRRIAYILGAAAITTGYLPVRELAR